MGFRTKTKRRKKHRSRGEPSPSPDMEYQVSYLVRSKDEKGMIAMRDRPPKVGEVVTIRGKKYRIVEVETLILPLSRFAYYHALCEPV
ncbi:MAG: hypothetical protein Q9O62_12210 [Ardenticatenia bacterium]|nr:hypothetical protein [Ardenticatenia bacterium]